MNEVFNSIANFGFPIVVSVYLLMRFEKKIELLEQSIAGKDGLISVIEKQNNLISNLVDKLK